MKLTKHFWFNEFIRSQTAERKGIDNTLPPALWSDLMHTARCMEIVRATLGHKTIIVSSGYRSPKLNAAIGGSATSQHMKAQAVDFVCETFGTPYDIVAALKDSYVPYDQLIYEGTWVHISFLPPRREVLTWSKARGYEKGLVK